MPSHSLVSYLHIYMPSHSLVSFLHANISFSAKKIFTLHLLAQDNLT